MVDGAVKFKGGTITNTTAVRAPPLRVARCMLLANARALRCMLRTTVRATWCACNICDTEASNVRVGRGINATRAGACEGKCRQLRCGADCGGRGCVGCVQYGGGGVVCMGGGAVKFKGGTISNANVVSLRMSRSVANAHVVRCISPHDAACRVNADGS